MRLAERWNGHAWHVVPTGLGGSSISKIRLFANGRVWVVGQTGTGGFLVAYEHHGAWKAIPGPADVQPSDVLALSPGGAWVVGYVQTVYSIERTISHWDGSAWTTVSEPEVLSGGDDTSISPGASGQPQWAGASAGISPSSTTLGSRPREPGYLPAQREAFYPVDSLDATELWRTVRREVRHAGREE